MTRRLPPLPLRRGVKRDPFDLIGAANPAPQCPAINYRFGRVDRCTSDAEPLHDLHSASGYDPIDGEVYGVAWFDRRALYATTLDRLADGMRRGHGPRCEPPDEEGSGTCRCDLRLLAREVQA